MNWTLAITLLLVWALVVFFFRVNRIWLPYYLVGSVGLAFAVIFIGMGTPVQEFMESSVALSTFRVANFLGIPARIFEDAPGSLMVFVIGQLVGQDHGWTMVRVTVECSGLLETGVMAGLVGLYPAWPLRKRVALLAVGIVATYGANIIRMTVIIATLHFFGKDALFIAHTIIGRAVFFVFIISIFWFVITMPTMRTVARKLYQDLTA